jgi:uncharacterized protein YyaL (SSP411 family)
LSTTYVEAFQATGQADYARVARETFDYVLREMTSPEGGFYSTLDADSEGEEGKFYVWTPAEIEAVLGSELGTTFCRVYDVSPEGNFEGHNILNLPKTIDQCARIVGRDVNDLATELAESRARLLETRNGRVWPGLDDKVLVSWNGLMLDSLAYAAGVFDEPRYLQAASAAADFVLTKMRRPDGRLLHSWRLEQAKFAAYLDDYACLGNALVTLYEAGFDERWIDAAVALADIVLAEFEDRGAGGFFYTATDHERLIARQKDVQDGSVPSGNSMAVTMLLRLGKLCGRTDYLAAAEQALKAFVGLLEKHPAAAGQMLIALDFYVGPTPEIVIMGDSQQAPDVVREIRKRYLPNRVLACRPGRGHSAALDGAFAGKSAADGEAALYVCQDFVCQQPAIGREAIAAAVAAL